MSGADEAIKNVFPIAEEAKQALDIASTLIGAVSSVWGEVNTVKSTLEALGVLSQEDPVQQMRECIDQLRQQFDGAIAALDAEQSMRAVADQLESARTQLENLTEFAPEDAATVGKDSTWDELRPLVLAASLQAVNTLADNAYWLRVYFPELTYQKWPQNTLHPSPEVDTSPGVPSGTVFDYRLTLPAFMEVISIRLTILAATVNDYRQSALPELTAMATVVENVFQRIRDHIWNVGLVPSNFLDDPDSPQSNPAAYFVGVTSWIRFGTIVGAVDIYSARDQAANWPTNEFPLVSYPGSNADWQNFLVRYAVRDWVRFKQLYDAVGLNAVATVLVNLKRLAGIEPATLPPPLFGLSELAYTCRKIQSGEYSVRELARMIHDIAKFNQQGNWNILDDGHFGIVNPLSMREIMGLMQTFNPQRYTSFREALGQ